MHSNSDYIFRYNTLYEKKDIYCQDIRMKLTDTQQIRNGKTTPIPINPITLITANEKQSSKSSSSDGKGFTPKDFLKRRTTKPIQMNQTK